MPLFAPLLYYPLPPSTTCLSIATGWLARGGAERAQVNRLSLQVENATIVEIPRTRALPIYTGILLVNAPRILLRGTCDSSKAGRWAQRRSSAASGLSSRRRHTGWILIAAFAVKADDTSATLTCSSREEGSLKASVSFRLHNRPLAAASWATKWRAPSNPSATAACRPTSLPYIVADSPRSCAGVAKLGRSLYLCRTK